MAVYKDVEELLLRIPTTRLSDTDEWYNGYNKGWYDFRGALAGLPDVDFASAQKKVKTGGGKMKKYVEIYKCRMCGKLYEKDIIPLGDNVAEFINGLDAKKTAYCFHICDNGDIGLCEYQGIKNTGEAAGFNDILHCALQKQKEDAE